MLRSLFLPVLVLALSSGTAAHADEDLLRASPEIQAQCAALGKLRYPEADYPLAAQKQMLRGCSAPDYYYGIRQKQDFTKARHCALLGGGGENDPYAADAGVLMMLYANGQGVKRSLALAKKAACAAGGAPMELSGRLRHLEELGPKERIDHCDDITSGMMMGYCSRIDADKSADGRERALTALTASWTEGERLAFVRLRRQADAFMEARSRKEVDLSGSARGAMVVGEEESQKDAFYLDVKAFEGGKLPRFSEAQYEEIDRGLNTVYQKLRSQPDPEYGTVKMADILATQRIWLRYRDAWVEFGKLRYPEVPAYAWRAHFTRQRTAMLKDLLEERG